MLPTSARLLKALSLLQSRRFWTGRELADALAVTERSVRRDVDRLRALGYPVAATSGVGGGYALGAGADLPPLPLDDDEAVAVAVGLRAAATGPVGGLEEAAIRALGKLEQVLPQRLRARLGSLEAVSVRLADLGPVVDGEVLAAVANACREEALLSFTYRDRNGAPTTRRVEPYRLVHTSRRWYLVAFDRDRDDWRTFRVDRVATPRAGHPFRPRPLPAEDLADWVSRRVSTEAYRYRARVRVLAPAAEVSAAVSPSSGRVVPETEATCLLETGGDDARWMALYLGALGLELEVLEPPALAEAFGELSARFARAAGRSGVLPGGACAASPSPSPSEPAPIPE